MAHKRQSKKLFLKFGKELSGATPLSNFMHFYILGTLLKLSGFFIFQMHFQIQTCGKKYALKSVANTVSPKVKGMS